MPGLTPANTFPDMSGNPEVHLAATARGWMGGECRGEPAIVKKPRNYAPSRPSQLVAHLANVIHASVLPITCRRGMDAASAVPPR